jgi:hypothetical protein
LNAALRNAAKRAKPTATVNRAGIERSDPARATTVKINPTL